jgi:hypothetical protein
MQRQKYNPQAGKKLFFLMLVSFLEAVNKFGG